MEGGTEEVWDRIRGQRSRWLVTGGAGFIGSHLVEALLGLGQQVVVLDDGSTGRWANLDGLGGDLRRVEGDIRDPRACAEAMAGVRVVLHQAALGSVPRSMDDPKTSHSVNVDGFVTVLEAARAAGVERVVYASSSSVYGGLAALPATEGAALAPQSPYAATKVANEALAAGWWAAYGLSTVGLRYFNVCGARQRADGAYTAVVPRWVRALADGERPVIFGDGLTSRDFCPVGNVVQANLRAAVGPAAVGGRVYNVALGQRTTLLELAGLLRELLVERGVPCEPLSPVHEPFRPGDVRHTHADLTRIQRDLGYRPEVSLREGLAEAVASLLG